MDPRVAAHMGVNGEAETAEALRPLLVTNGGFKTRRPQEGLLCILHRLRLMPLLPQTRTLHISFQDQAG